MNLREQIEKDIRRVAEKLGHVPSRDEYLEHGRHSKRQVDDEYGSWSGALMDLGIRPRRSGPGEPQAYNPPPRDPAAHVKLVGQKQKPKKLTDTEISEKFADRIEECAKELGCTPQEVGWFEFREYIKHAYGNNSADLTPRDLTRLGGFYAIRDAYFAPVPLPESAEKTRIREHAQLNRRLGTSALKNQVLLERVEEFSSRVFAGRLEKHHAPEAKSHSARAVVAVLSDLHIGSDLRSEETGHLDFGVAEEARRLALIFKEICEYKIEHRDDQRLELLLLGDIIQGSLHDPRDGAVVAEQVCRAIHLLTQGIAHVAKSYSEVVVRCATGNHGRDKARHFGRATFQKFDSHETVIYYSLKAACQNLQNVRFEIPKTPYVAFDVFGKKFFASHGDTVLNPGNPGKSINIKSLEDQINRMNASLVDLDEFSVVIVGHVHTASMTHLNNGAVMITNGALVPADNFAISIGILESNCGQWLFEATAKYPVGDARLVKVDRGTDQDESLEKFIRPWQEGPGF